MCNNYQNNSSGSNSAQLYLNGHNIRLDKVSSKKIYKEVRSKVEIIPTAQLKYSEKYNYQLDWKEIYCIPFRVTVVSRSREFQFKVLHRYLATNKFLHKIGLLPSFLCTFCKRENESIEHLLIECDHSNKFWQDLIDWFNRIHIKVEALSDIDKIFGVWKRQADFHLLNHSLILAKQHIYSCRNKGYSPSLKTYPAKVSVIYQIETTIADSNDTTQQPNYSEQRQHLDAFYQTSPLVFPRHAYKEMINRISNRPDHFLSLTVERSNRNPNATQESQNQFLLH
ncbi:hypothetical protein P5673_015414 [Acropora cervicornis]|uniref:Reverse transcriptase zinc-binding domain-containing protein n=1 Tax=Acropora cervicornis TaxID=6130 RepID=A0AAD9QHI1_ACRCE|nr:hypothetical protein P5673_015414 [Acropora cervicornis]